MTRNTELFDLVADAIEAEPHRYNQSSYYDITRDGAGNICGTSFCVAGWAVRLTVGTKTEEGIYGPRMLPSVDVQREALPAWEHIAAQQLGLTVPEADRLFAGSWMEGADVKDVVDALRRIGRGADINDPWEDEA